MDNNKVFAMSTAKVYGCLVEKAERKGRSREEVDQIICWLTGYDADGLKKQLVADVPYGRFFEEAPCINPNSEKIKGVICGIRVEQIEDPLMQKIRWLDKLVDELARGKSVEKILRK